MNMFRLPKLPACLLVPLSLLPLPGRADGVMPGAAPLASRAWFGPHQAQLPPLDTPLLFARQAGEAPCPGCTRELLSLVYEQSAGTAYPWVLYSQLDTAHTSGDAVGIHSRAISRGPGWTSALHGETIVRGSGTVIGLNAEVSPLAANARTIGVNLQAKNGYGTEHPGLWSGTAVNLQSDPGAGWATGIQFDQVATNTGVDFGPGSSGARAIRVQGAFPVGLVVAAGQKVCFEPTEQICLRFNPANNRLQILNGNRVITAFATGKPGR